PERLQHAFSARRVALRLAYQVLPDGELQHLAVDDRRALRDGAHLKGVKAPLPAVDADADATRVHLLRVALREVRDEWRGVETRSRVLVNDRPKHPDQHAV